MKSPLIVDLKRNSLDDGPGIRTTIFFKGCPLSCVWCQNPETKLPSQQVMYEADKCVGCQECMKACSQSAIHISLDGAYPIDVEKCQLCGNCVRACLSKALQFAGEAYDLDDLCKKLMRDAVFFKNSNGGVTFSGGEATLHLDYVSQLARKLKENQIHLCLETCGLYHRERFDLELLPYLDLVYFDIKLFDGEKHRKFCGVPNDIILNNFKALIQDGRVAVLPRIPLIPGYTDDDENLESIRDFFKECGIKEIGLLPYNPLWLSKSRSLGVEPEKSFQDNRIKLDTRRIKKIFEDFSYRDF
jgi:pyruvate formate lyase activating enzyme